MQKQSILLAAFVFLTVTSPPIDACEVEEIEIIAAGYEQAFIEVYSELVELTPAEIDAGQALYDLAQWEILIDAITALETGDLDERIEVAEEFYWEELLDALDSPPDDDRTLAEQVVERLRAYVSTEPKSWLVYQIGRDLDLGNAGEIAPLLLELTFHPAPSVRADAIDNLYNYLTPWVWSSWEDVERQLGELWNRETHTSAKIALVEAMAYYEVELPYHTLAKLLRDANDELAEVTTDYLTEVRPDHWIDLLLRQVVRGERERSRDAIGALTLSHNETFEDVEEQRLRAFFESRMDSQRYAWARNEILALLARLGSGLAETRIRAMFWSSDVTTALAGLNLLRQAGVADWPQCIARRALDGDAAIRERALYEIVTQPWIPEFDRVVTQIALHSQSRDLVFAAMIALRNSDDAATDRSHLAGLWKQLKLKYDNLPKEDPPIVVVEVHNQTDDSAGFDPDVTHVVVAPSGQQTVRCFRAPDCEGPADKARRLPTGHPISGERFEDVDTVWLEVDETEDPSCWVSETNVVARAEYQPADPVVEAREEVDIARVTLRSPDFVQLEKLKVLETFDIGTRLAGCRLTIDVGDSERLERLRKATNLSRTNLAVGVRQLFPEIKSTYGTIDGWEAWARPSRESD